MLSINRNMSNLIFSLIIFLLFSTLALGDEYHVSKRGSDLEGNGSLEKPWATISYALSRISEGDILFIHKGVYKEKNLKVRKSHVIITSYEKDDVVIDGGQNIYSNIPVMDIDKVKDVTIKGLKITGGGGIGCIIIGMVWGCSHVTIEGCEIWAKGRGNTANNPSIIRFYNAKYCQIRNCKIHSDGVRTNTRTAIKIWSGASHIIIENNEIFNIGLKAIDDKHGSEEGHLIIRYNYIHDIGHKGINLNSNYSIIEDNLIVRCGSEHDTGAIVVYSEEGRPGGSYSYIVHNTIFMAHKGGILLGSAECNRLFGCIVMNNIIVNCYRQGHPNLEISPYLKTPYNHQHLIDYNLYYNWNTNIVIREYDNTGYTLPAWQYYSHQDAHSIQADPMFINKSGHFEKKQDFILSPNSPAKGMASDGRDLGADIPHVGIHE